MVVVWDQTTGMRRRKPLSDLEARRLDESWDEMGESIAAAVLVGGKTATWAWRLLRPLGLYKRWMIDMWIDRYRCEHPELDKPVVRRKRRRKATDGLEFTKREQIEEALRMLNKRK